MKNVTEWAKLNMAIGFGIGMFFNGLTLMNLKQSVFDLNETVYQLNYRVHLLEKNIPNAPLEPRLLTEI